MGDFDFDLVPKLANYGIVLDGQYLVVDFDNPSLLESLGAPWTTLPKTWTQRTRRGFHLLYKWTGGGRNVKFPAGDIKVRGYIIGPNSVVDGHAYQYEGGEPADAPAFLVEAVLANDRATPGSSSDAPSLLEQSGVPSGQHDEFLYKLASWARGRYGLSQDALATLLRYGPVSVLADTDPDRPYMSSDIARIARSAASHEAEVAFGPISTMRCGVDVLRVPEPQKWVLPGFVPQNALTILYGDGKIGKSSWASWLAARVSREGGKVVFVPSGEETFDLFVMRARLNGCEDGLLYEYADPRFNLREGVDRLQKAVEDLQGVALIYIDALYSQFGPSEGEDAATRARTNLMPLARMAETAGVAILGTIHENAQGNLLGSREMRNVCRSLIHAKGGKGKPFTIWSAGSNGWSPDYGVSFPGHEEPIVDTETGEVHTFRDLYDELIKQSIWVLEQGDKIDPQGHESGATEVVVDEIQESVKSRIRSYLIQNPNASNREVSEDLGIPKGTVLTLAGFVRAQLGISLKAGRPPKIDGPQDDER